MKRTSRCVLPLPDDMTTFLGIIGPCNFNVQVCAGKRKIEIMIPKEKRELDKLGIEPNTSRMQVSAKRA